MQPKPRGQAQATTMEVAKARARLMALQTQKEYERPYVNSLDLACADGKAFHRTLAKAADRANEDIRSKKVLLEME